MSIWLAPTPMLEPPNFQHRGSEMPITKPAATKYDLCSVGKCNFVEILTVKVPTIDTRVCLQGCVSDRCVPPHFAMTLLRACSQGPQFQTKSRDMTSPYFKIYSALLRNQYKISNLMKVAMFFYSVSYLGYSKMHMLPLHERQPKTTAFPDI